MLPIHALPSLLLTDFCQSCAAMLRFESVIVQTKALVSALFIVSREVASALVREPPTSLCQ
jgi:hypothetical protein